MTCQSENTAGAKLSIHYVDAFVGEGHKGNRAAIVGLCEWLSDDDLLAIAQDIGLPETSFFLFPKSGTGLIPLRWFSQKAEVQLCGHGTLASAYCIRNIMGVDIASTLSFETKSGLLTTRFEGENLVSIELPRAEVGVPLADRRLKALTASAVGHAPSDLFVGTNLTAVYPSEPLVAALKYSPAIDKILAQTGAFGFVATARAAAGSDHHFVSRFFCPAKGVIEEPATGSTHCALAPFWARQLGELKLTAIQLSPQGGLIDCEVLDDAVILTGRCAYSHQEHRDMPVLDEQAYRK